MYSDVTCSNIWRFCTSCSSSSSSSSNSGSSSSSSSCCCCCCCCCLRDPVVCEAPMANLLFVPKYSSIHVYIDQTCRKIFYSLKSMHTSTHLIYLLHPSIHIFTHIAFNIHINISRPAYKRSHLNHVNTLTFSLPGM